MLLLARDVRSRGWASLNVGYRRLGRFGGGGGYPATFDDVRSAVDLLADHDDVVDLDRVVLVGHSAGGHLALWVVPETKIPLLGVISAAGVTNIERARQTVGGAVHDLTEGAPEPDRYALTSPYHRVPIGVKTLCVHGDSDETVIERQSTGYVAVAREAGDDAEVQIIEGGRHRDAIVPSSNTWKAIAAALTDWFESS